MDEAKLIIIIGLTEGYKALYKLNEKSLDELNLLKETHLDQRYLRNCCKENREPSIYYQCRMSAFESAIEDYESKKI